MFNYYSVLIFSYSLEINTIFSLLNTVVIKLIIFSRHGRKRVLSYEVKPLYGPRHVIHYEVNLKNGNSSIGTFAFCTEI